MMKKILIGISVVVLAMGIGGAARHFWPHIVELWHDVSDGEHGDDAKGHKDDHDAEGHEGHKDEKGHDEHAGHGHEEGGADLAMSIDEILAAKCEHDMRTYQCEECRYEVGVVKVDSSLLKSPSGATHGLVKTVKVSKSPVSIALSVTGEVQLNENTAVHITSRVPGIIRSVNVDIGAQVKRDDVLFEIDSVELGEAMNAFDKNKTLMELARKNYEREKSLFDKKLASEGDMIDAQIKYEEYQTELRAAKQKLILLGLAEKQIASATQNTLGRLATIAPSPGTIIEKHAVSGELVEPGKDVMLLADLRTVWVWANIYEDDLAMLIERKRKGSIPVNVTVQAFPGRVFKGEMDYIGATMDEKTRTVKVRATVRNDEQLLRPGMFCGIRILLGAKEEVVAVPNSAVLSDEGRCFVFRHLKDGYYVRRAVKPGREFDNKVEILDGVKPGDVIISDGSFLLKSDVLRSKMGAGCAH